ncbi:MAG: thiamine pyrophosphate-binding protein [SAR202 cluster bacterium]|jgi:thiamine pyrophosphate-dependent acetolactate synthase large subunit-like protein|nr:MAG: thiamine pyrophosphate-binding protein [SAR202 cluster bacterium]MCH2527923.1 thiamine pyrophosphate-dependent enzyme [Dehalococcoidia bacterium]MQG81272.1 thiamine pyrophosphate-binding protein [SAR202 cluster bacterium]
MLKNQDAVKVIDSKRNGAIIVPTMNANNVHFGLPTVTTDQKMDLPISGAMGKASSVGLGVALAQPDKKVLILDGDGSLLMNLGSLVTLSNKSPKNLYHFLFNNNVYAVTGGQPIPGAEVSDWEGMAKAAGYAKVFSFDNLEDLTTGLDEVFESEGPVFVHLRVEPEIENTPVQYRTRPSRTVQMAIKELPETLGVR